MEYVQLVCPRAVLLITEAQTEVLQLSHPAAAFSHTNPFIVNVAIMVSVAAVCFTFALLTGNCSHVDRIWSIIPGVYVAVYAREQLSRLLQGQTDAVTNPRLLLMSGLVTLWCIRLTYNFARRGGYRLSFEDHRWPVLRKLPVLGNPIIFQVFNLVFVAAYQNLLLFTLSLPAYVAYKHPAPLQPLDLVTSALFLLFLLGELTADQQQHAFQTEKYRRLGAKQPLTGIYKPGFVTTGLFKYSRHPNFFCEQAIWWTFYLFAVSSSGCWLHPALVAPVLLSLLFDGSTRFTEYISAGKYPLYRQYQRTTSRLLPWLPAKETVKLD